MSTDFQWSELDCFRDERLGIHERFLRPELGGAKTVAVLTEPLRGSWSDLGWVICHSFALEQSHLQPFEVSVARMLGAQGFPVLRYHGQGYGDSQRSMRDIDLQSHIRDATDAIRTLREESRVTHVGLMGSRLGATVAALVATDASIPALALVDPIVKGDAYVRHLTRLSAISTLLSGRTAEAESVDPASVLRETGTLSVQGFLLTRRAYESIAAIDLNNDAHLSRGYSLLVQVSRSGGLRKEIADLVERHRSWGRGCEAVVIRDPNAPGFGGRRFEPLGDGTKIDLQEQLLEAVLASLSSWTGGLPFPSRSNSANTKAVVPRGD